MDEPSLMSSGITEDYSRDDNLSTQAHLTAEQLQGDHDSMTGLQSQAHSQQVQANLLTTSLRAKLRRKDQELRYVKSLHEQRMSALLAHMLFLEGQLQKDQKGVLDILQDKDDVIRRQKSAIDDLAMKNQRLLQALKDTHGYATDNGLIKAGNVLQQNGQISIQDHGNKVILRSSKTRIADKISGTAGRMVRFRTMTDKLRRHKSSLELYRHEPLETLMENTPRCGSEENLVIQGTSPNSGLLDRKERCRSLVDYPYGLSGLEEAQIESPDSCFGDNYQKPIISRNDSTSSLTNIGEKGNRMNGGLASSSPLTYGFNELSKSRSVPHALPTVSENASRSSSLKERPHSLPSVEKLTKDIPANPKSNMSPSPTPTNSVASPASESNPFKSIKNVFKRKGSKKKKSSSVAQGNDQSDAMKQHFQKYDMS